MEKKSQSRWNSRHCYAMRRRGQKKTLSLLLCPPFLSFPETAVELDYEIRNFSFQRLSRRPVPAHGRVRAERLERAPRAHRPQGADRRQPPQVRPEDLRVRPGPAEVLRAGHIPAERGADLRARRRPEARRGDGMGHRVGTTV